MKKIAVLLTALLTFMTLKAADPDFAYPKTTLENAIKNYDTAIKDPSRTGIEMIKSLLEITGATAAIDRDSLVRVVPRIDRAIAAYADGSDKALMLTIKAEVLNAIYSGNRWVYDRMETPDEPLPADITEWNGRQFESQINSTLQSSFNMSAAAPEAKIGDYRQVITADNLSRRFFPTITAFIASKAKDLINATSTNRTETLMPIVNKMIDNSVPYSDAAFSWTVFKINLTSANVQDDLKNLFLENRDHEAAGYVLINYLEQYSKVNVPAQAIVALNNFIDRYPDFWGINTLKNLQAVFTQPEVSIKCKSTVTPGKEFEIRLNHSYTITAGFKVYRINSNSFDNRKLDKAQAVEVKSFSTITDPATASADTVVSVTVDRQGYYAVQPIVNGDTSPYNILYLRCLPYIPGLIYHGDTKTIVVADYSTGKPLEGAGITEIINTDRHALGSTNVNGFITFTPGKPQKTKSRNNPYFQYSYDINYQGETQNFFRGGYRSTQPTKVTHKRVLIFSDRQLYHPGDTIHWAAIAYKTNPDSSSVWSDQTFYVQLFDPNYQEIEKITVKSDASGRISGTFAAPFEGLTGSCPIRVSTDISGSTEFLGTAYVEVSDFKLPTFVVKDISVSRDKPSSGVVSLSSTAMTYSGMPVAGAKVEAEIWDANRWRWFAPSRQIGSIDAATNDKGEFTITVPDSITDKSTTKCFVAKITVTSVDGEARKASVSFSTGKPYLISYRPTVSVFDTDNAISGPFDAFDASGKNVTIDVKWWITPVDSKHSIEDAVASGICLTDKSAVIPLNEIPAGVWCLSAAPVDSQLADTVINATELTLYNIKKNTMPSGSLIFVPSYQLTADFNTGKASVVFGVNDDDTYVYRSFAAEDSLVSLNVDCFKAGFHKIDVTLPEGADDGVLILFTVRDGMQIVRTITVNREDKRRINLEGSSMRDHITAGASEHWNLKLTDADAQAVNGGNMIATMFSSALNALSHYNLPSRFNILKYATQSWVNTIGSWTDTSVSKDLKRLTEQYLIDPKFKPSISISDLYQYKFMARSRMATPAAGATTDFPVSEDKVYVGSVMMKSNAMSEVAEVTAEAADFDESIAEQTEEEAGDYATDEDFQYRSGEVLQAFWMPELKFNDEGEAEISFTVPDANTTWSFNAFAWTEDLRAATMVREFVASKPVMVQPNLPRFLRVGDRARLLATVFNNSDSTEAVTSVIEIFDLSTGVVKSTSTSVDTIAPAASAVVAIDVAASDTDAAIGYRVRSTLGRFTDGEQNFIPVIPSTSAVIESDPFYLNPGEADYSTTLPRGKDMQATLEYSANPAWNIIKELPGLSSDKALTSPSAARQLFAAATASGLLRDYPALAEVIKAWNENPDSEAFTSRLAKNEDLKAALLNATPWVQAAASDSERMARLALLFDRKAVDSSIRSSIDALKKLHNADGGWSWGSWSSNSSVWVTNMILQDLGRLNSIGYLPEDNELKNMIASAISYYESKIDAKTKTDGSFTFIATLFPDAKIGLRGKQIIGATVQSYITGWKSATTWEKAIEALILSANGHKAVAKTVMASLSEFAVTSRDQGTSFPSVNNVNDYADLLYAFAKLNPGSNVIDGMRQWLVLRQQTTSQLGSYDPTRLIAAFVATGSAWLGDATAQTTFSIGGKPLTIENAELATGNFVTALPSDAAGAELKISRHRSDVPAYGAVLSRFNATSKDIKASSCSDLSIEKRITVLRDGRWQYADNVRLGEQVRVVLTIKAKRDLEYVTVIDERPAAFEPVDQLPGRVWSGGAGFYRENRNTDTNLFIDYLPKGTYQITVDMTASVAGSFTSGIATVQSQLAPEITAHSAGATIVCE